MGQDPKQKPAHSAPSKPSFTPPPAGKPAQPHHPHEPHQPHHQPHHAPGAPAPKHTDPKKK
jgi:hypothetical protein